MKFTKEPYKTKTSLGKKKNIASKPKGKMLPRVAPGKKKTFKVGRYSNGVGVGK